MKKEKSFPHMMLEYLYAILEPLHIVAGDLKWYSPCGKEFGTSSKC